MARGGNQSQEIKFKDSNNIDAFGRLRVSTPTVVFASQFTYDLQSLIYEAVTAQSGATVTHNTTSRNALMTFSSTPTGGQAYMQTYQHIRYEPGKSQEISITFNAIEGKANVIKFVGISDGTNGYEFIMNGVTPQFRILSGTASGNLTANQSVWNIDRLDGLGALNPSGITIDFSKAQILIIDYQALYVGRVRMGFNIGGEVIYCHEFNNANAFATPYIQTANLPIRVGMTCSGTVSTTMDFNCCSVITAGGQDLPVGYEFVQEGTVTASSGARTHILSVRPKTTFNSIVNRTGFSFLEVNILATGSNPILWELCVGQAISGTTTFNDVNTTYSASEYNTLGTISGSPTIVIDSGYVSATNQTKTTGRVNLTFKYPITLDVAGVVRSLGTISLIVTGIGGSSTCRASIKWSEIR